MNIDPMWIATKSPIHMSSESAEPPRTSDTAEAGPGPGPEEVSDFQKYIQKVFPASRRCPGKKSCHVLHWTPTVWDSKIEKWQQEAGICCGECWADSELTLPATRARLWPRAKDACWGNLSSDPWAARTTSAGPLLPTQVTGVCSSAGSKSL